MLTRVSANLAETCFVVKYPSVEVDIRVFDIDNRSIRLGNKPDLIDGQPPGTPQMAETNPPRLMDVAQALNAIQ